MSEMLDRIRDELQQRLEATRAAAQEHERVRAALEALEKTTKQVTGEASRRARSLAARARPATGSDRSAAAEPKAKTSPRAPRPSAPKRAASPSRQPAARRKKAASPSRKPAARSRPTRETGPAPSTPKTGTAAPRARTRAGATAKPTRARAPRGANRAAVLAVVRERPGVTANELAAASGVTGGTLYALLRRLTEQGELTKRELPGRQTGYALGSDRAGTASGTGSERRNEAPSQAPGVEVASTDGPQATASPAASSDAAAKPGTST
jgi:hypothetical protein